MDTSPEKTEVSTGLSMVIQVMRTTGLRNSSIGMILCKTKNNFTVEYALRDIHKPMGVAGYETKIMESLPQDLEGSLPTVEEFEAELAKDDVPSDI